MQTRHGQCAPTQTHALTRNQGTDLCRQDVERHAAERLDDRLELVVRGKRVEVRLVSEVDHYQLDVLLLSLRPLGARRFECSRAGRGVGLSDGRAQGMVWLELVLQEPLARDRTGSHTRAVHPLLDRASLKSRAPRRRPGIFHDVHGDRAQEVRVLVGPVEAGP